MTTRPYKEAQTVQLEKLFLKLEKLLSREVEALKQFDVREVRRLSLQKVDLTAEIETVRTASSYLGASTRKIANRVRKQAITNSFLLEDAASFLRSTAKPEAGTYDRLARPKRA